MKIVFTGLPHFGKKLVSELNAFDKKNKYVFCDTYYSKIDRFRFIFHLLSAHLVVSINGVSSKSGSLDWVIKRKKKLILQWQGTDVLTAIDNAKGGTLNRKYIDYASSYTDAEWLQEELKILDVNAPVLHFKHLEVTSGLQPFKTNDVVSYLSEGKENFYGLDQLIILATAFPEINFHIIGSKGIGITAPENIIFYGWVQPEKVKFLMNEHPVFIRLTEHDGYALSVMEAIANGNYVLWNHPHPGVTFVKNRVDLIATFAELIDSVNTSIKARRVNNIEWAKANLNREKVLSQYIAVITAN